MDDGLKWGEWTSPGSATRKYMEAHWSNDDVIYAVSDSGGLKRIDIRCEPVTPDVDYLSGADIPTYDDLEEWGKRVPWRGTKQLLI